MKEQNRFVLVNGMGYTFAYHNLFTSGESRGDGRRWCKQISSWEILLKYFLSENGKGCAHGFAHLRFTWKENGIEVCAITIGVQLWRQYFASFLSDMETGHWVIRFIFVERVIGNMQVAT